MLKTIHVLVDEATKHLSTLGYSSSSAKIYQSVWKRFEKFCIENNRAEPDRETGKEFLEQAVFPNAANPAYRQQQQRSVMCLFDLSENGSFPLKYGNPRIPLPGCHSAIYEEYVSHLESGGELHYRTIYEKKHYFRKFLNFLESRKVADIDTIKAQDVYAYLSTALADAAVSSKASQLYFLRELLQFLVETRGLDQSLANLFPVILANKDAVLPSVYSADELRKVIEALDDDSRCARRNRAVVLLAVQLGMRVGDIKNLRLDQFDWRNRKLSFSQSKTKRKVNLPLPEECMFAILDYTKNERPETDLPYLFVKCRAPYGRYVDYNTFHQVIAACFRRAGIDTQGKHYGLHSLRHSTAVNMLLSDTPYPVISGVLGHTSANTTKIYLKADIEQLRRLSLEVSHA